MGANQSSGKRKPTELPRAPPAKIQKVQKTFEAQEESESDEEILEKKNDGNKMNNNQEEEAEDEQFDEEEQEDEDEEEQEEVSDEEEEVDDEEEKEVAEPANPLHVIVSDTAAEKLKEAVKKEHEGGKRDVPPLDETSFRSGVAVQRVLEAPVTSDLLKRLQNDLRNAMEDFNEIELGPGENEDLEEELFSALGSLKEMVEIEKEEKTSEESETLEELHKHILKVISKIEKTAQETKVTEEPVELQNDQEISEDHLDGLQKLPDLSETSDTINEDEVNGNEKIDN